MAVDFSTYEGRQAYRDANPGAIVDASGAYNPSTGQTVNAGGGGGGGGTPDTANLTAADLLMRDAQNRATNAYNMARLANDSEQTAYMKAYYAFQEAMGQAELTGTYQGAPTQAALQYGANTFGTWGVPTQGQQTLASQLQQAQLLGTYQGQQTQAAQQQQFAQQQALAQLYGQYYAPGQNPAAGMQTQAAQQQAFAQDLANRQFALSQQTQQQQAAQQYLNLMAGLRGPADWIQYQKVLGATPRGLTDLAAAAAGQYVPGGGATTGVQPQAVTLPGFINSATGGAFGGQQPGATQQAFQQYQGGYSSPQRQGLGSQAPVQQFANQGGDLPAGYGMTPNWQTGGQYQSGQGRAPQPAAQGGYGGQGDLPAGYGMTPNWQQGNYQTAGRPNYGQQNLQQPPMGSNAQQTQAFQNALVAPNQLAPQSWSAMTPSQQQMLLGTWESQGYTQDDAKALFNQSLPRYSTGSATTGQFRLQ